MSVGGCGLINDDYVWVSFYDVFGINGDYVIGSSDGVFIFGYFNLFVNDCFGFINFS